MKKYRKRDLSKDDRGLITNRVDIDKGPKIVEVKQRIGDLEIDLVIGKDQKGTLLTINETATRLLFKGMVSTKESTAIEAKTIELLKDWKPFYTPLLRIMVKNLPINSNHQIVKSST